MDDIAIRAQKLLHLAVAVGYIRHTIAAGSGTHTFASAEKFSKAHLALPAFTDLAPDARRRAEFEIFEYV
jgi:hypothetical protein